MADDSTSNIRFPAEWEPQSGVQLTWPHEQTDWRDILDEVIPCFAAIAREIATRERLIVACHDVGVVRRQLGEAAASSNVRLFEVPSNDTWARDHGPICVLENGRPSLLDFTFNGWGMKFAAGLDNQITRALHRQGAFRPGVELRNCQQLVLEGGSIESDGAGTVLTTEACLLSANRNDHFTRAELEGYFGGALGVRRFLWLGSGYLAGDDTDSHVDTLARLCDARTIAYVRCEDSADEHVEALRRMEAELRAFRTPEGRPYDLVPLPMAEPAFDGGERLPATYANFLIVNGAVLMPTYGSSRDGEAADRLRRAFPGRDVVGVPCLPLTKQHGSLHCVTMQYPEGFLP